LARLFQGRHDQALAAFRQALAIDPDHVNTTLNLADTELALGREREAEAHYREVLERLTRAQCLAHLGQVREAVKVTQDALRRRPDDLGILQAAALVYTLVGDRASALVSIQNALEKGLQPRWFTLPAFTPLRDDPELRALLRENGG
jgi:tetratricopeptide (TPR) repeat protein